ncbi:hypothetical protein TNCV_7911 [Trichonephila clavipes]|nr:hypothetical protein TNCV_7911 [Trichonephila clavipes]
MQYKRRSRLDAGCKGLQDGSTLSAWEFFFQAQQQVHYQAEESLSIYVIMHLISCSNPVQMVMLFAIFLVTIPLVQVNSMSGRPLSNHFDEVHFWLNGYVNKQNCRIWSEANPQVYVETPIHPETLTVWCALLAGGIIGLLQKR